MLVLPICQSNDLAVAETIQPTSATNTTNVLLFIEQTDTPAAVVVQALPAAALQAGEVGLDWLYLLSRSQVE